MHYPFLNELRLLMIIPIVVYITLLTKHKFKNKQLSILTILTAYELIDFLEVIMDLNF